jgi:VanZ family protein
MGTLSFLANLSLCCRTVRIHGRPLMLGTIVVLVVVALEELSQAFITTRSCDAGDFGADALGILLGAIVAKRHHTLKWRPFRGMEQA